MSDALVTQVDFIASFAALLGGELPPAAAPDSFNVLPALVGESKTGREYVIQHANGQSIRKGSWKLVPNPPRGRAAAAGQGQAQGQARAQQDRMELFNLAEDPGETKNVAAENPQVVTDLRSLLQNVRTAERTRP